MKKSPFLDRVREVVRVRHLSYRTEKSYLDHVTSMPKAVASPLDDLVQG